MDRLTDSKFVWCGTQLKIGNAMLKKNRVKGLYTTQLQGLL